MSFWNLTQRLSLILGVLLLAHAVGGMIVNPDFSVGSTATAETWLWMDWNGWHALAGILLWTAGIAAAFRPRPARLFGLLFVATNLPIVIWMLFDPRPLGLFLLPTMADLIFHAAVVVIFAGALIIDRDARTSAPAL